MRLVLAVMTLFAAEMKAGTKEQLTAYRDQIDSLDQRIVELIQASFHQKNAQWKRAHQIRRTMASLKSGLFNPASRILTFLQRFAMSNLRGDGPPRLK